MEGREMVDYEEGKEGEEKQIKKMAH